jgi:hypothetical protein
MPSKRRITLHQLQALDLRLRQQFIVACWSVKGRMVESIATTNCNNTFGATLPSRSPEA